MSDQTHQSDDDDENLTTSTAERWEWIGTILAGMTITSANALVLGGAYGFFTLSAVGQAWFILYSTLVLMAATWAFGKGTLKAVQKARGNN